MSWVESLAWSSDGKYIGAVAGANVAVWKVVSRSDNDVRLEKVPSATTRIPGGATGYDLTFLSSTDGVKVAVGAYGGVTLLRVGDNGSPTALQIGGAKSCLLVFRLTVNAWQLDALTKGCAYLTLSGMVKLKNSLHLRMDWVQWSCETRCGVCITVVNG